MDNYRSPKGGLAIIDNKSNSDVCITKQSVLEKLLVKLYTEITAHMQCYIKSDRCHKCGCWIWAYLTVQWDNKLICNNAD